MRNFNETGQKTFAILKEEAEKKVGEKNPSLYYDKFVLIDTNISRFAIDDISYKTDQNIKEALGFLFLACKGEVNVFDAPILVDALAKKLRRLLSAVDQNRTVVIFPGTGSQVLKELLPSDLLNGVAVLDLPAQRKVDEKSGTVQGVTLGEINKLRKTFSDTKAKTAIVLDDVIMSGATLQTIQDATPGRNIEWFAGSLMMLSPNQKGEKNNTSESGVNDYNAILTSIVYQGINKKVPALNSISTLVGNSTKSEMVRTRYMQKYVDDSEIFLDSVKQLQINIQGK